MLRFLAARAIPGVECVTGVAYHRTVGVGEHRGWLSVSPVADRNLLAVDSRHRAGSGIAVRFSCACEICSIWMLGRTSSPGISRSIRCWRRWSSEQPGLRVPGAFDSFELGMRAILGQQVSVRGASTLAGRFAQRFGEPIETPLACLNRIAPTAEALSAARSTTLAGLGLPTARAESLRNLARSRRSPRNRSRTGSRSRARSSSNSWSFPASDRGPRSTSRCVPCAGPTHFPRATWG